MNGVAKVSKNVLALGISQVVQAVSYFFTIIIIARMAGSESLGLFSFTISFIYLGMIIADFGLPNLLTRDIAAYPDLAYQYLVHSLLITLVLGFILWGILVVVAVFLKYPSATILAIAIAGGVLVFRGLSSVVTATFDAFQRMELSAFTLAVQELTALSMVFVVLYFKLMFHLVFVALLLSRFCGLIVSVQIYRRLFGRFFFTWDWRFALKLFRKAWPYVANSLAGVVYLRFDILALNYFHGNRASGIYEAAMMLPMRLQTVAFLLNRALLPAMAQESERKPSNVAIYCSRLIEYLLLFGIPVSLGGGITANRLISFLYGKGFEASVLPLKIFFFVVVIRYLTTCMAFTLTAIDAQKDRFYATFITAVVSVVSSLTLIPSNGVLGATVARVVTFIAMFVSMWFFMSSKKVKIQIRGEMIWKIFVCAGVMGLILRFVNNLPVLMSIPLGGIVFFSAVYLLRVLDEEDIQHIRGVWNVIREKQ